jgi:alpha-glucoside transport system ATP-binding protein
MVSVTLRDIHKSFGDLAVLCGINLEINTGELIVVVGPSGCGKTTLLRMIAGLETVGGGRIELDGRVINAVPPAERGIAMVFQSYALYPHMSVRDNMAFGLKMAGKGRKDSEQKVIEVARALQIEPVLDRLPAMLSGGQRQRVAIGRALVRDPRLFLFDEPLSNLDASLRAAMRLEVLRLKQQMPGCTMIYVTHDQVEAMTLADRIVVMAGGRIVQVGAPMALYERPKTEFVAQFIGSPAMNLLEGEVVLTGARTTVRLRSGGVVQADVATCATDIGRVVRVGLRAEDLRLSACGGPLHGRVAMIEPLGDVTLLHLAQRDDPQILIAKLTGTHLDLRGAEAWLDVDPAKVHLFHEGLSLLYR